MADALLIREIGADEFDLLWPIFHEVVAAGETYSYAPDMSFEQARQLWTSDGARCFVALLDGACVGGYMLHANQPGLGNHVANCGYMVTAAARGGCVGRSDQPFVRAPVSRLGTRYDHADFADLVDEVHTITARRLTRHAGDRLENGVGNAAIAEVGQTQHCGCITGQSCICVELAIAEAAAVCVIRRMHVQPVVMELVDRHPRLWLHAKEETEIAVTGVNGVVDTGDCGRARGIEARRQFLVQTG